MNSNLIEKILSGEANSYEKDQFDKWLSDSEENRELYEKTRILWNRMDGIYAHSAFDQSAAKINIRSRIQAKNQSKQRHKTRVWISAAASILLLIGLGLSALYLYNQNFGNKIIYTSGETVKEIQLSDGSHVWLNFNSSLQVAGNFGKKQRKVMLKGEAYFEVNRDESKPFKIYAGETVTEVLGTSFNIESDTISGNVNVIVNTGKVGFYDSKQKDYQKILLPNDHATYLAENQKISVSSNSDLNFLAWKTGILNFYDTPVSEVCKVLSKQYHKQVICKIKQPDMTLTGTFQNESLDDVLNAIKLTLEVDVIRTNNQIVVQK